jgi:3-oxoacyl-[acyl-carrier protein] reductase
MDLQLSQKVAIVTGGSRGLGFASARALVDEGCHVVICARGADRLEQAADELRVAAPSGTEVLPIVADVSTAAGIKTLIDTTIGKLGGIDVLVNNVGLGKGATLTDTSDETWQEAIDQTLFPVIRASRAALPFLKRREGTILIISSIFGREAGGRMTYNAVKAAEISLAKSLAQQLAKDNVRVVSIAPGRSCFRAARGMPVSRPILRASRTSSAASCRSGDSAGRKRWAMSWRFSRRRGRAG